MRGLVMLQQFLDDLPEDARICRNAWCGYWERNNGQYEPHVPHETELIDGDTDA